MNVNRNSLIQNDQTVENKQPVEGKLKHSKLTLGEPKPKTGETKKNFFSIMKDAISSRFAKIVDSVRKAAQQHKSDRIDKAIVPKSETELSTEKTQLPRKVALSLLSEVRSNKELRELVLVGDKTTLEQLEAKAEKIFIRLGGDPVKVGGTLQKLLLEDVIDKMPGGQGKTIDGKFKQEVANEPQKLKQLLEKIMYNGFSGVGEVNPNTIFRGAESYTRFNNAFAKTFDKGYTGSVLKPIFEQLDKLGRLPIGKEIEVEKGVGFNEADVLREKIGSENVKKLLPVYQNLLDGITGSVNQLPQEICDGCAIVFASLKKANASDDTAFNGSVVNTIALRLINPGLATPGSSVLDRNLLTEFELQDSTNPPGTFMILSKVFQNQANNKLEVTKDPVIKQFEELLQKNKGKWDNFAQQVIARGVVPDDLRQYLPRNVGDVQNLVQLNQPEPMNDTETNELEEFKNEVKSNFEDINNEAFIEVSGENVDDLVGEEIFDVINRDGGGFREEDSEVKGTTPETVQHNQEENTVLNDIKEEFVQRNKEEDELMNELLNLKKN